MNYSTITNIVNRDTYNKYMSTHNVSDGFTKMHTSPSEVSPELSNIGNKYHREGISLKNKKILDVSCEWIKDREISALAESISNAFNALENKSFREGICNDPTLRRIFTKCLIDNDKDINSFYIDSVVNELAPKSEEYFKNLQKRT